MDRKIKSLTKKESGATSKLKQELLRQIGNDAEMILFGSKARRDANEDSDIDILVLVDGEVDNKLQVDSELWDRIWRISYDIEREYDFEIDFQVIIRSRGWWESWKNALPFAQNVAREGIWL